MAKTKLFRLWRYRQAKRAREARMSELEQRISVVLGKDHLFYVCVDGLRVHQFSVSDSSVDISYHINKIRQLNTNRL